MKNRLKVLRAERNWSQADLFEQPIEAIFLRSTEDTSA